MIPQTITVRNRAPIPRPSQIKEYLLKSDWKWVGGDGFWDKFGKNIFSKTFPDFIMHVCLKSTATDYKERTEYLLTSLENFEGRLSGDILGDILNCK